MHDQIQFHEYQPSLDLSSYVSRYVYNQTILGIKKVNLISVASGNTELYFYLNKSKVKYKTQNQNYLLQNTFVVGIEGYRQKPIIELNDVYEVLMVEFKPGAFYQIFGVAEHELLNWIHNLELIGNKSSKLLIELIHMAESNVARINIFESFVRSALRKRKRLFQIPNIFTLNTIGETNDLKKIGSNCGMSVRQLERIYKEILGICPIQYQQIKRINNTFKNLHRHKQLGWASFSLMLGYYDQSHFIKEFKNQTGITPSDFIEKVPDFFYNQKWSNRSYIPILQ